MNAGTGTGYVAAALDKTNSVLSAPIVGNVDTVHLFLMTGVLIIGSLIWGRILSHFSRG